jgi:hypothetical protein
VIVLKAASMSFRISGSVPHLLPLLDHLVCVSSVSSEMKWIADVIT